MGLFDFLKRSKKSKLEPTKPEPPVGSRDWLEIEIQKVLDNPKVVALDPKDEKAVAAARRDQRNRIARLESMYAQPSTDDENSRNRY